MKRVEACKAILMVLFRFVYIGFMVTAALAFLESRKLLTSDGFDRSNNGTTLLIPLEVCTPGSFSIDGDQMYGFDPSVVHCQNLDYLVNACAASLIISAAAVGLYILFDIKVRCGDESKLGYVTGMGFFLSLILVQAGLCAGALANESQEWQNQVTDALKDNLALMNASTPSSPGVPIDNIDTLNNGTDATVSDNGTMPMSMDNFDNVTDISNAVDLPFINAEVYGDIYLIYFAAFAAFLSALLALVECCLVLCCASGPPPDTYETNPKDFDTDVDTTGGQPQMATDVAVYDTDSSGAPSPARSMGGSAAPTWTVSG